MFKELSPRSHTAWVYCESHSLLTFVTWVHCKTSLCFSFSYVKWERMKTDLTSLLGRLRALIPLCLVEYLLWMGRRLCVITLSGQSLNLLPSISQG